MGELVGIDLGLDDLDVVLSNLEVKLEGLVFIDVLDSFIIILEFKDYF